MENRYRCKCPSCHVELKHNGTRCGSKVICPGCKKPFTIPEVKYIYDIPRDSAPQGASATTEPEMVSETTGRFNYRVNVIAVIGLAIAAFVVGTVVGIVATNALISNQSKIEKQFSVLNGSHFKTTRLIKEVIDNPDSYIHIETKYDDKNPDSLVVYTTFSFKNVIGVRVKCMATATFDADGLIVDDFRIVSLERNKNGEFDDDSFGSN